MKNKRATDPNPVYGLKVIVELNCDNMTDQRDLEENYNGDLMQLLAQHKNELFDMATDFKILGVRIKGKKYE